MPPTTENHIETPLLLPADPVERARRLEHFLRHARHTPGVHGVEVVGGDENPRLRIDLDSQSVSFDAITRWAEHAGIGLRERWGSVVLAVEGMASKQSEQAIEGALAAIPGVRASASFPSRTVRIEFDRARCQLADVALRLSDLGFRVSPVTEREAKRRAARARVSAIPTRIRRWASGLRDSPELAGAIAGALLLLSGFLLRRAFDAPDWAWLPLVIAVYPLAGWHTARDTLLTLIRFRFNIDVLMFVAAIGAGAIGHWEEGALLLVLFSFGHAGESLAMDKARRAIEALHELAPDSAMKRTPDGSLVEVAAETLEVGDTIVVRPGDRVGADGEVLSGYTSIDQSAITGESTPVEKSAGSHVFAGTINGDGAIDVRVTRSHHETTLAKAIRLVEEAQTRKGQTELFTAKVERFYVPFVLGATALLFFVPLLVEGFTAEVFKTWFYRSMAFLTAASPCALAIGTPAATLSALARAARLGVLIKGGAHLETLAKIDTVAFDKTGTLTEGRPRMVGVVALGGATEDDALFVAASLEAGSAHPLARAILEAATARGWAGALAEDSSMVQGKGLRGTLRDAQGGPVVVEVGSRKLYDASSIPTAAHEAIDRFEREHGATAVLVRRGEEWLGVIALADPPRPDAASSVAALRSLGVKRQMMLTGDNEGAARAIGASVGLDEVRASLMPEDKLTIVGAMVEEGRVVAMVGDGVNDAPALAAASLGVAMGAAGSDAALETADVALLHDRLERFPQAVALAKFARRIVFQNLLIAMGVIVLLAPLAATGYASIGWAVLFHEGSTVVVVLNALRLLAWRRRGGSSQ